MGNEVVEFTVIALVALGFGYKVLKSTVFASSGKEARQKTDYAVRSQGWSIVRFLNVFSKRDRNGD